MFLARKHWNDPKSETIACESSYNRTVQDAHDYLVTHDRDYEGFDVVETDDDTGEVIDVLDCVSWEPRG